MVDIYEELIDINVWKAFCLKLMKYRIQKYKFFIEVMCFIINLILMPPIPYSSILDYSFRTHGLFFPVDY